MGCTNGLCMGCDRQAKIGACKGMTVNYFGEKRVDNPGVINRGGSLDLECDDSNAYGIPSCKDVVASCPDGTDSCSIKCGENACESMQVYLGKLANQHMGFGHYDDLDLSCAKEESSCKDMTISCVEEDKNKGEWQSTDLLFDITDNDFKRGKVWFCDDKAFWNQDTDNGCCPTGTGGVFSS